MQYKQHDLKRLQIVQVEIMKEVIRICTKYNILYIASGGTVLGAYRHKGFIPWDDDIDLMMFRSDYNKFLKIAKSELDNRFFLQNFETDQYYTNYFTKIRMNNTLFIEHGNKNSMMHHGIFIDIFPLDKLPKSNFKKMIYKNRIMIAYQLYLAKSTTDIMSEKDNVTDGFKFLIRKIISLVVFPIKKEILYDNLDKLCKKYNASNSNYYMLSPAFGMDGIVLYEDMLCPTKIISFENVQIKVPKQVETYLSINYGENFMQLPPLNKRVNHRPLILSFNVASECDKDGEHQCKQKK